MPPQIFSISSQKGTVAYLKSNILTPKILGWLRHCTCIAFYNVAHLHLTFFIRSLQMSDAFTNLHFPQLYEDIQTNLCLKRVAMHSKNFGGWHFIDISQKRPGLHYFAFIDNNNISTLLRASFSWTHCSAQRRLNFVYFLNLNICCRLMVHTTRVIE